jgi:NAD(P)-dependent dehydrogenase (short-subunit alcohol dehydrogenase family)
MERLDGRRIIITGGTSGMGRALVEVFPSLGAKVVFFGRSEDAGVAIANESGSKFLRVDVSNEQSVNEGVSKAVDYMGGLDVLIHSAAISPKVAGEDLTLDDWNQMMDINSTGTFLTNVAVFPHMKENGGHIINIISSTAIDGYPSKPAYAASKGAQIGWSKSIALAWVQHNIQVNMIAPAIDTPMYQEDRATMSPEDIAGHDAFLKMRMIGGKMGDPKKDFAPLMAFLASKESRYLSGQIFSVCSTGYMTR